MDTTCRVEVSAWVNVLDACQLWGEYEEVAVATCGSEGENVDLDQTHRRRRHEGGRQLQVECVQGHVQMHGGVRGMAECLVWEVGAAWGEEGDRDDLVC